ncbi:MAG: glycosyltransferase family 39 protein [Burkholderiales bacterium]|nr:glycosyltransferase family 39 protein [Burkholderiales bacterium]
MKHLPKDWRDRLNELIGHPAFLPATFLLYIGLRALLIAFVPVEPSSDFAWYHNRAVGLVEGAGYSEGGVPTAFWPVGWPAAAAGLYWLFGKQVLVLQIANLVFGALTFVLVVALGRAIFASEQAARLGAFLLAVYPNNIAYASLSATETFYTFLLLLGTWLIVAGRRMPWAIAGGLVFGYATLTKPQTLLMPMILIAIPLLFTRDRQQWLTALRRLTGVYLALALVITPWLYRNYQVFGEPVFISTNSGWALLVGNNPSALAHRGFPTDGGPEVLALRKETFTVANQVESNRRAKAAAVAWIRDNPGTFLLLMPIKAFSLWSVDGEAEWSFQIGTPWYDDHQTAFRGVRILNQVFYLAMMTGFAAGAWLLWRRYRRLGDFGTVAPWALAGYGFAAITTLQCMVMAGSYRYKFPLMPFIILTCAWSASCWLQSRATAPAGRPRVIRLA